jgi:RNA polymerase-binding transcription factor DksA
VSEFTNESVSAIEGLLDDVDAALERLRVGTYRTCQICSAPLDDSELEANPLLARCGDHLALA